MEDTELDIILSAVDNASDTFESVQSSAEDMGQSIENVANDSNTGLESMESSAEEVANGLGDLGANADEAGYSMEQLLDYCNNMYAGKIEELANETERAKQESDDAGNSFDNLSSILSGIAGAEIFTKLADALWDVADKAGTFEDSLMRARLEAEGAGISANDMTDAVSELSRTTGRAGGEIREAFITATARGITDLDSFKQMMIGAGAQATLLGTDIDSMANKMSGLAMRSSVMERTLANTGITVEELGEALGIQGATIDDINEKWETMDTNQRAAALGMAASMNEGKTANEEYKKSWAGLQAQLDIAKGRLERLAGEVLLPVLIPALEVAGRVLNWLGDTISAVMDGPLGGLVSAIGAVVAGFALVVPAIMAIQGAMALYTASLAPAITATWALLSPWLPFIAIGAAIVALIYEIGKAFGWWTDASSAIDAVWAGIQRLWSAFINHPDVQGFLSLMAQAWNWLVPAVTGVVNAVLRFFGVSSSSNFDFVRALINAIGIAWNQMTFPIRLVITVVKLFITTMVNVSNRVKAIINGIKNIFARLPGAIRGAISSLTSIITHPVQTAKGRISGIVGSIKSTISGITHVNIGSLTSKLTQPVTNAYTKIAKTVSSIIQKIKSIPSNIPGIGGALGFDYEGMLEEMNSRNSNSSYVTSDENLTLDHNINFTFDFNNLPDGTSEETLVAMLRSAITDRSVINSLVNSPDFQSLDGKVKERLVLKGNRARGV